MNILVTGGAGFVGSIIVEQLLREDHKVIILDNLQQGHREAVPLGIELIFADICDLEVVDDAFKRFKIDTVMHMAADTVVKYSITDPKRYFHTNIIGGINLLNTLLRHDVHKFVFSSSAAVYGEPQRIPIEEKHPTNPINAYGESKLMFERILQWYGKAYGIKHISLRYFNAAGATKSLGEDHSPETHLIPLVLRAVINNGPVSLFGIDYPTKDGTCLRDYVHVLDIARAHILAMDKIDELSGRVYNLGTTRGYSVREVVKAARKITGANILEEVHPRRPGDPPILIASSERAKQELGWSPKFFDLETIVGSAWDWLKVHPHGYRDK